MARHPLFSKVDWHTQLRAQIEGLAAKVQAMSKGQLQTKSLDDLATDLVQEFRLDVPALIENDISVSQDEIDIPRQRASSDFGWMDDRGGTVRGTRIRVTVPFEGDKDLFRVQPPTYSNAPFGEVQGNVIIFEVMGTDFAQRSPKPEIDRNISAIRTYLEWQKNGLGDFEAQLQARAVEEINRRSAKLTSDANVLSGLGYKIN